MTRTKVAFEDLFARIDDGVCISNDRQRVLYLNPAAERLLGVSRAKAVGRSSCSLICARFAGPSPSRAASRCPLRSRSESRTTIAFEGRCARRPSAGGGIDLGVRCLRPNRGRGSETGGYHLTILQDVSAHVMRERQREDWRNMVVHDLNAPLTNIYSVLHGLKEEAEQAWVGPSAQETLEIGLRNCRRMIAMLELYLAVARFDACLMPVKSMRLELAGFVRELVADQTPLAAEKRISIDVDVPAALTALGDPQLLSRAIQNLLNNALKFSPRGGRVEITAARDASGRVALCVRDAGPGIDPRDLPHIFDRYAQAQRLQRREGAGTGLGLTFCRQAVAAMKGELTVESKLGEGSAFTLHLPAAQT